MDVLSADAGRARKRASRHARLPTCLAWVVALILLIVSPADATPTPSRPADSFVGSIGINTHFYYSDTPYVQRFDLVKQRLAELGVRHVRENIAPDYRPDQYQRLRELAAMGIKGDLILGDPRNGISTLDEMLSRVKTELTGALDAVEGPNEFNARGVAEWIPKLREYQQHLYTAVKSDPSLSPLTVIAPSITDWRQAQELGDLSGMIDVGNVHPYTSKPPETVVGEALERAAVNAGSKPAFTTETGYHTALNYTGPEWFMPVTEAAQAVYMPRAFLEFFRRGFRRTYSYELLNEFPDPELTHREWNWGLLRNDLSKKPAFDALRNLIAILNDPGPAFTPEPLEYTISGDQTALRQVLLQKRDGSFYLALWRATSVWDAVNQVALNPSSSPVTISFAQPIAGAERYLPNKSSTPVEAVANPTSLNVEVGPEVMIVKLTRGTVNSPEPTSEPEPTPAPAPEPAPEETTKASHGKGGGKHEKRPRLKLLASGLSVQPEGTVTLRGRLDAGADLPGEISIQALANSWRTIGRSYVSKSGFFRTRIKLRPRHRASVVRLRVLAPPAAPSRAIRALLKT